MSCLPCHPLRLFSLCLFFLTFIPGSPARADTDTQLRLQQDIERSASQRERQLLAEEMDEETPLPGLIIDGQEYDVGHNRDDLGRALYLALSHHNWPVAARYLAAYLALDNPDPMLVYYAQGGLARARGDLVTAEAEFRALLALHGGFLPGRLALARVLFENQKNREAEHLFRDIHAEALQHPDPVRTAGVRRTLETYLQALERRRAWQGRIAVGPGYSDNVNQSSQSDICLVWFEEGPCYIRRSVPDPISAKTLDYEASLERNLFLSGHHGLFVRGLAHGRSYRGHGAYSQGTFRVDAGYRFRTARNTWGLAPLFEYATSGNDGLYEAWGARAEWMRTLSPRSAFRLEGDYKEMAYRREAYRRFNGETVSLFATLWHQTGYQWMLFGGLDASDRGTREAYSSYQQYGVRLGGARPLPGGVDMTLFGSWREQAYDTFNPLLEARRKDRRQHYMASFRFSRMAVAQVVPVLSLEHTRVRSNVGWLYSYEENRATLKLERQF